MFHWRIEMDPEGRPRGREGDQRGALTAAGDLYLPASHESSRVFKVTRSSLRSVWLLMSNLLNRSLLNRFYIFDSSSLFDPSHSSPLTNKGYFILNHVPMIKCLHSVFQQNTDKFRCVRVLEWLRGRWWNSRREGS